MSSLIRITPPGDKSISHRLLFLSALANTPTSLSHLNDGDDVKATTSLLRQVGVRVEGDGGLAPSPSMRRGNLKINCMNSGTTLRLGAGFLATTPTQITLFGDDSLINRPQGRVIEPLRMMGVNISSLSGTAPVDILPPVGDLKGIYYRPQVPSAQVKSSILFAGLQANGETTVEEWTPTRDHTERWFQASGIPVRKDQNRVTVSGGSEVGGLGEGEVPGDPSSAAFLAVANLFGGKRELVLQDVCLNPLRIGWVKVLQSMGAEIEIEIRDELVEPVGNLIVRPLGGKRLEAVQIEGELIPQLIDELPLLALVATQAHGKTTIKDAKELRVKESDRIDAICSSLGQLGARIASFDDGFRINGSSLLHGGSVGSYGDHRIAMVLGVAGGCSSGRIRIEGKECVRVSYPRFFEDLSRIFS